MNNTLQRIDDAYGRWGDDGGPDPEAHQRRERVDTNIRLPEIITVSDLAITSSSQQPDMAQQFARFEDDGGRIPFSLE